MYRLTQSEYQSKALDVEEGIQGDPNSESDALSDITSVLTDINGKMATMLDKIENIEEKIDKTEIEEEEKQYRTEIKDILSSINEKEMQVNIDLEDIKVKDDKNEEILLEIQDTKDIMVENIDMAKDFISIGFGVLMGVIVGYVILKFLGR